MSNPSILVIQVSRIGDSLFVTPTLRAVANHFPGARIDLLAHPKRAEVFEHLPFVQRIGRVTPSTAWMRGILSKPVYDYALVYGFDAPLVKLGLRLASQTIAFRQKDPALNRRLTHLIEPPAFQSEHAIWQLTHHAEVLGVNTTNPRIAFTLTTEEKQAAQQRLTRMAAGTPTIGIQPRSFPTKSYRDWPLGHFIELGVRIRTLWPNARFLIFGGPDDKRFNQPLAASLEGACLDLSGALSLRESGALMSCLDLYMGVDTGPTHLMSAFDIPMLLFYHCLSGPEMTGPLDHPRCRFLTLQPRDGLCAPNRSLGEISVNQAFQEIQALLGSNS
ncbi:MAG: glycosyltransferase family 9 protein [Magnetococcus sp. YQC-9]